MRRSDRGSVTIWVLGLAMLLLVFGGLAIDYWRALALQRELASVADSAAVAAAAGIDEGLYRSTGTIVLSPERSAALAGAAIDWQGLEVSSVSIDADAGSVTVVLTAQVELGLLGVFVDQSDPLVVRASASAVPVLVP